MSLMDVVPCIHCGDNEHTGNEHESTWGIPKPTAVPVDGTVSVKGAIRTNIEAADFGAYSTYSLAGTEGPFQILGQDEFRYRALVWVNTKYVWLGKREQIFSSANQGIQATSLFPVEIRNKQPVWCVPNGTDAVVVSVMNERWSRDS